MVRRDGAVVPLEKTSTHALLKEAERVFSKGMVDSLRSRGLDLIESGGEGSFLFDSEGNEYLDCDTSAGTYNLGRKNGALVEELRAAARELDQGNFVMISEEKARLASALSSFVPADLVGALFTVVRGEAMDAACKLARGVTGRPGIVTVDGGYHGQTGFATSLGEHTGEELFGPLIPEVSSVPFGDVAAARNAIDKSTAAVVLEIVQAESGCRAAGPDYVQRLRKTCDRVGAVLIIDETVTGFGRTGSRFAFERAGVSPDILVLGEALCGGLFPITALLFTAELKAFFDSHPLIHLCTFGGHDIGCRVARRALEEYERLRPWEHARLRGAALAEKLSLVKARHRELVRSLDGEGMLLALRLASPEDAEAFCRLARGRGLIVRQGKNDADTLLIRPSLLLSEKEMEQMIERIDGALADLQE